MLYVATYPFPEGSLGCSGFLFVLGILFSRLELNLCHALLGALFLGLVVICRLAHVVQLCVVEQ